MNVQHRFAWVLLGVSLLMVSPVLAKRGESLPHLRSLDTYSASLLADGRQRSATVRELERRLEASDVVVYVTSPWRQAGEPEASLRWVSASAGLRYVVIKVGLDLAPHARIELLGHELHHAREVADALWVHNDVDMRALFTDIGRETLTRDTYETEGARFAQLRVRRDLFEAGGAGSAGVATVMAKRR
jgi:hypothetical protein